MSTRGLLNNPVSQSEQRAVDHYLAARLLRPAQIEAAPADELAVIVTIPCFDEPDLRDTLESLAACQLPDGRAAEVIVLINAPLDANARVLDRNFRAAAAVEDFTRQHPSLPVHAVIEHELPKRHAGVGLARKLAMDEALLRLLHAGKPNGIILALDADCTCEPNYLHACLDRFDTEPLAGASLYFEHPLDAPQTADAITHYEMFLRYYRLGLSYAGSAHAFHTVGSSMCVRAIDYARLGGMNRRAAGEDFYFLQKFMDTQRFTSIRETIVHPAARLSSRVPFGTGAALKSAVAEDKPVPFYAPEIFDELRDFFMCLGDLWHTRGATIDALPATMRAFLSAQGFDEAEARIRNNVAGENAFQRHLVAWMNGFKCMKFARFASVEAHPYVAPAMAVNALCERLGESQFQPFSGSEALVALRRLDRRL